MMKRVLVVGGLMALLLMVGCWKSGSGPSGSGWSGFDPENGKFTVAMPGTPTEKPLTDATGKRWTSSADGLTYSVSYAELKIPAGTAETDQAEELMDDEVDAIKTLQGGTITGEKKPLMVGGVPGREVDIELDNHTMRRIRMCVSGNRLYQIEVSGPKDKIASDDANSFLDSFRLGK